MQSSRAVSEIEATPAEPVKTPMTPRVMDGGSRVASTARPHVRAPKGVQPRGRSGLGAIVLYPLLGLACLAVAIASFLVLANPADILRDRLIAQAKARFDRDLTVGGASLTYFPFGLALSDVELSTHGGPALVRAAAVDVHVSLLSLLQPRVIVSAVTMARPEINLSIDADGQRNWDFALSESRPERFPVRLAQLAPRFQFGKDVPSDLLKTQPAGQSRPAPQADIDVRVQDGTIRYSDARTGAAGQIAGVNLRVGLNGGRPVQLSGNVVWSGEAVSLEASVNGRDREAMDVDAVVKSRPLEANYRGRISLSGATELEGHLAGRTPSLDTLVRWLRGEEPSTEAGTEAAINGRVKMSGATLELTDASITTGDTTATGAVSVDVSRRKPVVRADLKLAALDFDRLRAPVSPHRPPPRATAQAADQARSIDDLLKRADGEAAEAEAPAAQGYERPRQASRDWSTRPVDLSGLRWVDLDGRFEVGRLRWRRLEAGPLHLTTTILDGRLTANATDGHLYGGHGNATLVIEQKGEQTAASLKAAVDGVATQALLKDLLDFDWLDGQGRLVLALSGEGASEKQIVDSLNGQAEIKVAEGALVGWDLNQMLRGLRQGSLPATDRHPTARTSFGELTGSFALADGVASNEDLKVTGRAVSLSGSGSIVYRDRTINYTVRSKLAEAAGGLEDIEIPVRIYGSWDKPVLSPNLDGVLKDPRTAAKLQQLGRQLRSGNVDEALKGVLGDGPEAEKKAERAKSILKRFLKQ